jgi:2-polyprenyl-3-methyl-5-hydroxy-6-metoxy-1,4-benzoquinol methylase
MTDRSNGYEGVAAEFLSGRGRPPSTAIGARFVHDWARALSRGATVLDVGCGSGRPITEQLVGAGLNVYAIAASPSLVHAFRNNLPHVSVACEPVEESSFFGRTFDP